MNTDAFEIDIRVRGSKIVGEIKVNETKGSSGTTRTMGTIEFKNLAEVEKFRQRVGGMRIRLL